MDITYTRHNGAITYTFRKGNPYLHPDYLYWSPVWQRIRIAEEGEHAVKARTTELLPKLAGHDWEQYKSYLQRATYYNATAKTLNSLYGSMFNRAPKVEGFTPPKRFSKDGMSLHLTAKTAAKSVVSLGRYGMLVDAAQGGGAPYVACYTPEAIIDWEVIDSVVHRVTLQEAWVTRDETGKHETAVQYRVLCLEPGPNGFQYVQYIFRDKTGSGVPDLQALPDETHIPTVRGRPLDHIPFAVVGPHSCTFPVQKPPMLDIVTLNLSHYQSYAELAQGRHHVANPVYTVSGGTAADETGEYHIGPDTVWSLPRDGKAEILEFKGQGLRSLESALDAKERQMAAIGGRLMPTENTGPGQSDAASLRAEHDERSLVAGIADALDEAFTQVLTWLADWSNKPTEGISFTVSREWVTKKADPREWRAIVGMYQAGHIPLDVLHTYLQANDIVPEWMDAEEFRAKLEDAESFPNNPDVLARQQGYPNAKSRVAAGELA